MFHLHCSPVIIIHYIHHILKILELPSGEGALTDIALAKSCKFMTPFHRRRHSTVFLFISVVDDTLERKKKKKTGLGE